MPQPVAVVVRSKEAALALVRFHVFCEGVLAIAGTFPGASCTSWGRSAKHNATLPGEAPDSRHLAWVAVDLVWDPGSEPDHGLLVSIAREHGIAAQHQAATAAGEREHWHLELLPTI